MTYPIRKIEAGEHEQFLQTMSVPFLTDPNEGWRERFRATSQFAKLWSAFDGDRMVSTFGSYDLDLTVPGSVSVPTAGTTLVTVLPTHRRQGILRSHMVEHFQDAHRNGKVLAALWASESHIYGRFGYGPATEASTITLEKPYAQLKEPVEIRGSMRLVSKEEALAAFPEIYSRVAADRPGMFQRSPAWWNDRILIDPEDLRRGSSSHRRVLHLRDGQFVGYAIFRTLTDYAHETAKLNIVEVIGQDPEAERALWQFLFGVDLITTITHWNRPLDDPLFWWLEQPREMWPKRSDSVWVRPLNVIEALQRRKYSQTGELTIRYRDEYCPWNDGVFLLKTEGDGSAFCETTTADPMLELTPFTLGAVYLGGHRIRELAHAGLITGTQHAITLADQMFAWPIPPWCPEVF